MQHLTLWTDGGYIESHPDAPGGWAFIVERAGSVLHATSGNEAHTSSERMELRAVIEGLRWVHRAQPGSPLLVATDAKLIVQAVSVGLAAWKHQGWSMSKRQLPNRRLWQDLDALLELRVSPTSFAWVKAHNGEHFNELADMMATKKRGKLMRHLAEGRREGAFL